MDEVYVSLINIISQEMVPHLDVFGSGVEHEIFGYTYGTGAITHERHMGTLLAKSLKVYVIQSSWEQQLATATYSAFLVD
jgi:hypothetical protein